MADPRLTALGLNDKERRFYLAALELGSAPVTAIAAWAGVTRTNGYDGDYDLTNHGNRG